MHCHRRNVTKDRLGVGAKVSSGGGHGPFDLPGSALGRILSVGTNLLSGDRPTRRGRPLGGNVDPFGGQSGWTLSVATDTLSGGSPSRRGEGVTVR